MHEPTGQTPFTVCLSQYVPSHINTHSSFFVSAKVILAQPSDFDRPVNYIDYPEASFNLTPILDTLDALDLDAQVQLGA